MDAQSFIQNSTPFHTWLADWKASMKPARLEEIVTDPGRVALVSVDVINGFCHEGPLASPRVGRIVAPIARLFQTAHDAGVRHFILTQDTHDPEAVEFNQWPAHCVRGTAESQTVPELAGLPFADEYVILPKNSIHSALSTGLEDWLVEHPQVTTFIVVGDCTDLCTYQLAMHLRLRANARQQRAVRVIVPEDCVDTYDLPVAAAPAGAMPHDGDLLHHVFLYSMALNGVEVVRSIEGSTITKSTKGKGEEKP